jgi:glycosyltransferase involved in cell wall biosynthesis
MTELETRLLREADTVVATSKPLWDAKRSIRPDVELVPHGVGVDYGHFARAWRAPLMPPSDLGGLRRPVFGFFGLIHHWFDVELMAEVARLRPDYSFALIGDSKVDTSRLLERPNIRLLGRRKYADLPLYCSGFAAGLLPFVHNEMTRCINPIKLTEYLAAGLPVVSTAIPAAEEFGGPVAIAQNAEEFAVACDAALRYTAADRSHISETVRNHTWEARVETLSKLVSNGAHGKRTTNRGYVDARWIPATV